MRILIGSYFAVCLLFTVLEVCVGGKCPRELTQYSIENSTLSDLCCPYEYCERLYNGHQVLSEDCCQCLSKPSWFEKDRYTLHLEYTSARGKSRIAQSCDQSNMICTVEHTDGYLLSLPDNICQYNDSLKILSLEGNFITDIDSVSCLWNLDSLFLNRNKIQTITNKTFQGMLSLREVHLKNNAISEIEVNALDNLPVLRIYFNNNTLNDVDITNVVLERPFCEIDYSKNPMKEITNNLNWSLEEGEIQINGGMVIFKDTLFQHLPLSPSLGFKDMQTIAKLIPGYGFDFTGANLICDCQMVSFLQLAEDALKRIWRDYYNVTCYSPFTLRHQSIPQLIKNQLLHLFVCNISTLSGCPPECSCYQQPSNNRTVVNCSHVNLTALPKVLPQNYNLEVFMEGNHISTVQSMDYMDRLSLLDLSHNEIRFIDNATISKLCKNNASVNLNDNVFLDRLPYSITKCDFCAVQLDNLDLSCRCGDLWMGNWLRIHESRRCQYKSRITCFSKDMSFPTSLLTAELLECNLDNSASLTIAIVLAILVVIFVVVCQMLYTFRYELRILYICFVGHRLLQFRVRRTSPMKTFDAYILMNESIHPLYKWVTKRLVPYLEHRGYNVCLPCRDFEVGTLKQEEIGRRVSESQCCIVMLSAAEQIVPWFDIGWTYIWHSYCSYNVQNIVIINYDHIQHGQLNCATLNAFLKLSRFVDFANHKNNILKDIKTLLGQPINTYRRHAIYI